MLKTLNLGCGNNPLPADKDRVYYNMDVIKQRPKNYEYTYTRHDIMKAPWPFEANFFDEVFMFHTIEHIPEEGHGLIISQIHAALKMDGRAVFSYPEFLKCADNYKKNKDGQRDFWKKTIYGRGLTEWDRHKALMDTPYFVELLHAFGFKYEKHKAERGQSFNTVLVVRKGESNDKTYESIMEKFFKEGR